MFTKKVVIAFLVLIAIANVGLIISGVHDGNNTSIMLGAAQIFFVGMMVALGYMESKKKSNRLTAWSTLDPGL